MLAPPPALSARDAWRRVRAPALVCAALLALCYLRMAPAASIADAYRYRVTSFTSLTYSDVVALHDDRGARPHRLPYLEDRVEYPVGIGVAMWLPSLAFPRPGAYFAVTFAALALAALGTLWTIARVRAGDPWAWGASPALLAYAGLNWDLLAIFLTCAGLLAWQRGRPRTAVAWVTLGVWTKFFPVVVLAALLVASLREGARRVAERVAVALAITVAVNAPFALLARENWWHFFRYNRARGIEPSLYSVLGLWRDRWVPLANAVSAAVVAGALAVVLARALRGRRDDALRTASALVCVWLAVNKVFSPQYWLWIVAMLAISGAPRWFTLAAGAYAALEYVVTFGSMVFTGPESFTPLQRVSRAVYWPVVVGRYVACVAAIVLPLRAASRAAAADDARERERTIAA